MGKTYKMVGQKITIQENLWNELIIAIDEGDYDKVNKALAKFRPAVDSKAPWSADPKSEYARENGGVIKTQFGVSFNKIKIHITETEWSWKKLGWITRSVELSPLQLAAKSGNRDIVDFLVRNIDDGDESPYARIKLHPAGEDVNKDVMVIDGKTYVHYATPLHIAAAGGHH